jgi:hypothetical protein
MPVTAALRGRTTAMPTVPHTTSSTLLSYLCVLGIAGCSDSESMTAAMPKDPTTSEKVSVDRFTDQAAMLQRRSAAPTLPGPNQPVDFDQGPFITHGYGPGGEKVTYYNFDIQSTAPAPIYVLFRAGESAPVPGQLNIIDVLPGEPGYNDFWRVRKVTVPAAYVANTVTSAAEIAAGGYSVEDTTMLVNCPVVPDGSTARLRINEPATLVSGWYRDKVVKYFSFDEKALAGSAVPAVPIYVMFATNPGQPGGGPASGFKTEPSSLQTHNVIAALPSDPGYSPLWSVQALDNAAFGSVTNLATARNATVLGANAGNVNCPVVAIGQ